ncbi:hypothetical protein GJ496_007600 [Pomphorhynchus laevis]|nr:hypothetical protein GJ496_007600 [Pomphorhynchus laevis]
MSQLAGEADDTDDGTMVSLQPVSTSAHGGLPFICMLITGRPPDLATEVKAALARLLHLVRFPNNFLFANNF